MVYKGRKRKLPVFFSLRKSKQPAKDRRLRSVVRILFLRRSADRAGACAGTAFEAGVSVDLILAVAFGNRADRALGRAGTTGDALIRNLICHRFNLHSF